MFFPHNTNLSQQRSTRHHGWQMGYKSLNQLKLLNSINCQLMLFQQMQMTKIIKCLYLANQPELGKKRKISKKRCAWWSVCSHVRMACFHAPSHDDQLRLWKKMHCIKSFLQFNHTMSRIN